MLKSYKKLKLDIKLLEKNKVGLVLLFGSRITGTAHPESDIDIGIVFEDEKAKSRNPLDVYDDLYQISSSAFKVLNSDIIYLREAPLSLQSKAINEGKIIYQKSAKFSADYKEEVMIKYFDFQYVKNYFNKVFLGEKV